MTQGALRFRPLVQADQAALWDWLHLSLWDPPAAPPRPREVRQHPAVRIYAEGWGRGADLGMVAVLDGRDAGACWMRLLPEGIGLASVDAATPQLGIALETGFRRQGIGTRLMRAIETSAQAAGRTLLVLDTRKGSIAEGLYRKLGYIEGGVIPGYARTVDGTLVAAAFFYRTLA